ncbi:MAG: biopolymer transporter ExbD [Verrucomicrobiota bacterium]
MHHATKGKAARAATRNAPEEDPEFQIAPMIDILLVLLVFFMSISSTEVLQSNRNISLAVAKDAKAPKPTKGGQIIVNVSWGVINNMGSIEVDNVPFAAAAQMVPMLREKVSKMPQTRVLIRADRAVRYDFLRQILKAVGDSGIANVTFSVVDKDVPGKNGQ